MLIKYVIKCNYFIYFAFFSMAQKCPWNALIQQKRITEIPKLTFHRCFEVAGLGLNFLYANTLPSRQQPQQH